MKCLENIVKTEVLKQTEHLSDQLQFAYRYGKGVDAILTILNLIHTHLEKESFYARILFFFFFFFRQRSVPSLTTEEAII